MAKAAKNIIEEEKIAQEEGEASVKIDGSDTPGAGVVQYQDEEVLEAILAEKGAGATEVAPAELAAIHPDALTSGDEPKKKLERRKEKKVERQAEKSAKISKSSKKVVSARSRKYRMVKSLLARGRSYPLAEAIELAKKVSLSKFDGSLELHLNLAKKKGKATTETTRGVLHLPNGTGKKVKVLVLDEAKIEEIAKTKKIDFDVAIAAPALMPKVAKIARILGPKGKMPDPRAGTVTDHPEKIMADIQHGRVEYRVDDTRNVHLLIGKISWDLQKLQENAKVVFAAFPIFRLTSATLSPSIGPSVAIDLGSLK